MAVEASQIANLLAIARHGSFTRAAAAEMNKRIADQLSGWATMTEPELSRDLEMLLGRPAESTEQTEALDYIRGYEAQLRSEGRSAEEAEAVAWTSFSRVMLSSNEFIYID